MGLLVLISGISGSGKTTIANSITNNRIVTHTSRDIREGEMNGRDYHFVPRKQFLTLLEQGEFVEHNVYSSNFYGTSRTEFESRLKEDVAVAVVDYNGHKFFKEFYQNSISIFIDTDFEAAIVQMKQRGDTSEVIQDRIQLYEKESNGKSEYDYIVENINGKLDDTIETVRHIILKHIKKQS